MPDDPVPDSDENFVQGRIEDYRQQVGSRVTDVRQRLEDRFGDALRSVVGPLEDFGLAPDWLAGLPDRLAPEERGDIWRYQYAKVYVFPVSGGDTSDYEHGRIEFKVSIYTVGKPTDNIETRLKNTEQPRLATLFNTGQYANYMKGFSFVMDDQYIEREPVAPHEVPDTGLGMPRWEVEAYDEHGNLAGAAHGYANPFTEIETTKEAPGSEEWGIVGYNPEGNGRWEIGPTGRSGARERLKGMDKTIYINGFSVSGITKDRGTGWLTREYDRPGATPYTDKKTIVEQTGAHPQTFQRGVNLYKVDETEDRIILSTTRPRDFDPIDPDEVDETATGIPQRELTLTEAEPTQFIVQDDEEIRGLLGKYEPPVVRDIAEGTTFGVHGSPIAPRTNTDGPNGKPGPARGGGS